MSHPLSRRTLLASAASLGIAASPLAIALSAPSWQTADRRATREVRALLSLLRRFSGKSVLSGQVDLPDLEKVAQEAGHTPAILGLDFMSYTTQMGRKVENTQVAIDWVKRSHGIVTFQWHWVSPTGASNLGSGFYTNKTKFDLRAALADRSSADYKALISDIDDVAVELKKMADARIPVLFRPLHEAQGAWFWWGAQGPGPCIELYKLIFERVTKVHGVHNIAWVWNVYPLSEGKGRPEDWYPGNDWVDVVATDYLDRAQDYEALNKLTGGSKVVAIAETMNPPNPEKLIAQGAPFAYWVAWARRDWNKNSSADMNAALNNPKTITLDKPR